MMKGVAADSLPLYLDERMWRDHWGATTKDAFESICKSHSRTVSCVKKQPLEKALCIKSVMKKIMKLTKEDLKKVNRMTKKQLLLLYC
jgi:hypothetical protein